MSNSLKFDIPTNYDEIWVIGFRIDPDQENYDVLTVIFSGDIDQPLTIDGYIVFFNAIDVLSKTLEIAAPEVFKKIDISEFYIVDIAMTLHLISKGEIDDSVVIVESLNIIIDLAKTTKLPMPSEYKHILYQAADYFTFSKEISAFFESSNITRIQLFDVIIWCMGAIVIKSKMLTNKTISKN
jgi:hypothetical protein